MVASDCCVIHLRLRTLVIERVVTLNADPEDRIALAFIAVAVLSLPMYVTLVSDLEEAYTSFHDHQCLLLLDSSPSNSSHVTHTFYFDVCTMHQL